jgi:hypothetical protein
MIDVIMSIHLYVAKLMFFFNYCVKKNNWVLRIMENDICDICM